ncbi:39S ribosomal protein L40, mitochondrial-like [Nematostella vectensis]|uniref:39S ribosomal protein L40, mitochondrial-like n=1 Tax=Nematostella vectensis TaxID=45351 RepID=UPI0020776F9D|nr:39S ribosomal protein L40, mitochondrial-like [Nematostella vectensis]
MASRSLFVRATALSVRLSMPGRHDPNVKKKSKQFKDLKKKKVPKIIRKPSEIVPPIDPDSLLNPAYLESNRQRAKVKLSEEEEEERILLLKEWSRYKMQQHKEDLQRLQEQARCREEALKELKKTSEFLYKEAIKADKTLFPLQLRGPTHTPPLTGYIAPDLDPDVKGQGI